MLLWAYIIFRNNSSNGTGKIIFYYYFFLPFVAPPADDDAPAFAYTAYSQGRLCVDSMEETDLGVFVSF